MKCRTAITTSTEIKPVKGTGKTKGRQKVVLKLLEDPTRRKQTFHKRAFGLLKKAFDLHVLTTAHIKLKISWPEAGIVYEYNSDHGLQRALLPENKKAKIEASKYLKPVQKYETLPPLDEKWQQLHSWMRDVPKYIRENPDLVRKMETGEEDMAEEEIALGGDMEDFDENFFNFDNVDNVAIVE